MSYPDAAWDRVMTVQDTLMKGIVYPRPLFDFAEASARSLGVVGLAATQIK
jgi:hypothetical protein